MLKNGERTIEKVVFKSLSSLSSPASKDLRRQSYFYKFTITNAIALPGVYLASLGRVDESMRKTLYQGDEFAYHLAARSVEVCILCVEMKSQW